MWPVQLAFLLRTVRGIIFSSLTVSNNYSCFSHDQSNWFLHLSPALHSIGRSHFAGLIFTYITVRWQGRNFNFLTKNFHKIFRRSQIKYSYMIFCVNVSSFRSLLIHLPFSVLRYIRNAISTSSLLVCKPFLLYRPYTTMWCSCLYYCTIY